VNSLPKTVTRQRRGCDLNPGPSVPESSTLTTRIPNHTLQCHQVYNNFIINTATIDCQLHWRQPRRGCRGHIPPIFWLGGTSTGISPPILLRTFGYSRPILVALRSLSLKPFSFGCKTPAIRFSQAGGQSAHKARPPNLELALTPLVS